MIALISALRTLSVKWSTIALSILILTNMLTYTKTKQGAHLECVTQYHETEIKILKKVIEAERHFNRDMSQPDRLRAQDPYLRDEHKLPGIQTD